MQKQFTCAGGRDDNSSTGTSSKKEWLEEGDIGVI